MDQYSALKFGFLSEASYHLQIFGCLLKNISQNNVSVMSFWFGGINCHSISSVILYIGCNISLSLFFSYWLEYFLDKTCDMESVDHAQLFHFWSAWTHFLPTIIESWNCLKLYRKRRDLVTKKGAEKLNIRIRLKSPYTYRHHHNVMTPHTCLVIFYDTVHV